MKYLFIYELLFTHAGNDRGYKARVHAYSMLDAAESFTRVHGRDNIIFKSITLVEG